MSEMTAAAYHSDTQRIGSTGLKLLHRSPSHYYAQYLDPNRISKPPTPAMLLGIYTHCAILEPARFWDQYVCVDDAEICKSINAKNPRATVEYRRWYAEWSKSVNGKEVIASDDYKTIIAMRDAVWSNSNAATLLDGIVAERSIYFTDKRTGALCKARPDGIRLGLVQRPVILEIKTCENASPEAFGRQAFNYRYHSQAAFYVDGYIAAGISEELPIHITIAVEKEPPYAIALYLTPDNVLEIGRHENAKDLEIYVNCLRSGSWHGYDTAIVPLQLPTWALRQSQQYV